MSEQVADRIYLLGDRYVNWYVIEDGDKLTVLDTGFPSHWEHLPTLLDRMGRKIADVDAVLLTHHHPDHLGSAERIRSDADAPVLIHEADAADALRGGGSPPILGLLSAMVRPFFARYVVHIARSGGLRVPPVADVSTFADGEHLDIPGRPRVIHTPGHTPGECVLHLADRDVLFTGDAIVTLDTATGFVGPSLLTPPFVLDQGGGAGVARADRVNARRHHASRARQALVRRRRGGSQPRAVAPELSRLGRLPEAC